MRNLSPLFSKDEKGFIGNLNLTENQKNTIQEAKKKIREHLRAGITREIKKETGITLSPRFLSQGSSVYKTQNQPCNNPPQQIDHDLGCYFPLSVHEEPAPPSLPATTFFGIVDSLLEEIKLIEKWDKVEEKDTCSRIIINKEIHIDIPLYSIPDKDFETIRESARTKNLRLESMKMVDLSKEEWEIIKNQVLLAHRKKDWIPSDPRKLNEYFKYCFDHKGEQLRRISRYLKAWRDYKWKNGGGPSSIYLMILADSIFKCSNDGRDDLALLNVLEIIPSKLSKPLLNPTDDKEEIRIKEEDKKALYLYASEFSDDLRKAIESSLVSSVDACNLVRKHVGNRFPLDDNLKFIPRDTVLKNPVIVDNDDRKPENRGRAG